MAPASIALPFPASPDDSREPSELEEQTGSNIDTIIEQDEEATLAIPKSRLGRSTSTASRVRRREKRKQQWRTFGQRAKYYVPVFDWLPKYNLTLLVGDLSAALTLSCLLIPQSMSYATNLAQLDPINGLLSAAIAPLVYALLGTCRQFSIGPEAALSLIVAQTTNDVFSHYQPSTPSERATIAVAICTMLTFQAGFISLALGLVRLGFLDAILSQALLRGFITGVGVVIFVEQLIPMLGLSALEEHVLPKGASFLQKATFLLENLDKYQRETALISLVSVVVLLGLRISKTELVKKGGLWKVANWLPEILIVVVGSTALNAAFRWDQDGVAIVGAVSTGDVHLHFPLHTTYAREHFTTTLPAAVTISLLGFLDGIVAAKQNSAIYEYPISPNRELVAIGAANVVVSFVSGCIPSYGSITRSRLAGNTGARTQAYGIFTGSIILLATFFLLRFLFFLPKCVLSSIILLVVYVILAEVPHDIKYYLKMGAWSELGLCCLTFFLTMVWSLQAGMIIGTALSLILVVKSSSQMRIKILGRVGGTDNEWEPVDEDYEFEDEIPGLLVVRIREVMTFANAGVLKERLRRLELYGHSPHHPSDEPRRREAEILIFHWADVEQIDAEAVHIVLEVVESYQRKGTVVYFTHVPPRARLMMSKAGLIEKVGEEYVHSNIRSALLHLESRLHTQIV
ncbi:sulfate permease [Atractiella rhizophila]|nr:sulfate permease [Atractiella rhizophila]